MRVHEIVTCSEVEGPGKRFVIWTQGCSIRCHGCFNTAAQDENAGTDMRVGEILAQIRAARSDFSITGITIAGGEPFDQYESLEALISCSKLFFPELNIMLYTGYELGKILSSDKNRVSEFVDILIHGPFVKSKSPDSRRWIGSTNQGIRFNNLELEKALTPWPLRDFKSEVIISENEIAICGEAVKLDL